MASHAEQSSHSLSRDAQRSRHHLVSALLWSSVQSLFPSPAPRISQICRQDPFLPPLANTTGTPSSFSADPQHRRLRSHPSLGEVCPRPFSLTFSGNSSPGLWVRGQGAPTHTQGGRTRGLPSCEEEGAGEGGRKRTRQGPWCRGPGCERKLEPRGARCPRAGCTGLEPRWHRGSSLLPRAWHQQVQLEDERR